MAQRSVLVTPLGHLVRDPYVVVTAGAVMVATSTLAVLEPCLPIWLTDNLHLPVCLYTYATTLLYLAFHWDASGGQQEFS